MSAAGVRGGHCIQAMWQGTIFVSPEALLDAIHRQRHLVVLAAVAVVFSSAVVWDNEVSRYLRSVEARVKQPASVPSSAEGSEVTPAAALDADWQRFLGALSADAGKRQVMSIELAQLPWRSDQWARREAVVSLQGPFREIRQLAGDVLAAHPQIAMESISVEATADQPDVVRARLVFRQYAEYLQ